MLAIKMKPKDFITTLQRKVAFTAVGPSALRGQGKGVLRTSQDFLAQMSLTRVPKSSAKRYRLWLDRQTELLLNILPIKNRPWGAARKAINLFLRDALYNKYLSKKFKLQSIETWLEVPLDRAVTKGLKLHSNRGELPRWPGLKNLKPNISEGFQVFASKQAILKGIARVHLDMYLWLDNR
ncbi:MAG: hypothetical protein IIB56_19590 [Planctomycetes bacterium]|nr:hypothetical protein [Planctomycetota bacterium]